MSTILRTTRLRLDPYTPADHAALHRLWTSAEVRRYLFDDEQVAEDFVAAEIEGSRRSFPRNGQGQWCIRRHHDEDVIGFAGLRPFGASDEPQLLYGLGGDSWGKGYATEAASAVLDYAFRELAMPRVLASTDAPNLASIAVMRRLGMRPLEVREVNGQPTPFYEMRRGQWIEIRPSELERRDCPKINLQVRATDQPVVDFYRRHGFEVEDRVSLGRRSRS